MSTHSCAHANDAYATQKQIQISSVRKRVFFRVLDLHTIVYSTGNVNLDMIKKSI